MIVFPDGKVALRGIVSQMIEQPEGAIEAADEFLVSEGFSRVRELDLEKPSRLAQKLPSLDNEHN